MAPRTPPRGVFIAGVGDNLNLSGEDILSANGIAVATAITNDTTTNATMYPVWVTATSGNLPLKISSTKMSFNPSTGLLTTSLLSNGFTSGSIAFAGAAGVYAQDNANLFWDDTNNRLGIGTNAPSNQLTVSGQTSDAAVPLFKVSNSYDGSPYGFIHTFECLAPNAPNGSTTYFAFGKQASNYERAYFGYYHNGAASTDNFLTMGLFGADNIIVAKANGKVGIGTIAPGAQLQINAGASATIGQIVKAAASQSASVQEWQDSAGTVMARIRPNGALAIGNAGSNNNFISVYDVVNTNQSAVKISKPSWGSCLELSCSTSSAVITATGVGRFVTYTVTQTGTYLNGSATYGAFFDIRDDSDMPWVAGFYAKGYNGRSTHGTNANKSYGLYAVAQSGITGGTWGAGALFKCDSANVGGVHIVSHASQTANLFEAQNSSGTALFSVDKNGGLVPASMTDATAVNGTIYYSTTAGKLVYKDAGGTVNNLY